MSVEQKRAEYELKDMTRAEADAAAQMAANEFGCDYLVLRKPYDIESHGKPTAHIFQIMNTFTVRPAADAMVKRLIDEGFEKVNVVAPQASLFEA